MPSVWEQHKTAIIVGVITSVAAGVVTLLVTNIGKSVWDEIHPPPPSSPLGVTVVDMRPYGDAPQKAAYANVWLHNDGTTTFSTCYLYWMTSDGKELAVSPEFGASPGQRLTFTLTRMKSSYSGNHSLTKKVETYAYVRCGSQRFKDSTHWQVPLY
jgi:hypothetical protein